MTSLRYFLVAIAFCLSFLTLTASSASAITITLNDLNTHDAVLNPGAGHSDLFGTWDITEDLDWATYIDPATSLAGWTIDSVEIAIAITDENTNPNDQSQDQVRFYLDTSLFLTDTSGQLDWSQTWTSNVGLGSATLFGSISDDGMLNYRIERTAGTFTVQTAELTVVATNPDIALAVPDGGTTLTMLGLGMVGLGALRRKLGA